MSSGDSASALLEQAGTFALAYPIQLTLLLIIFHLLRNKFQRGLLGIPGPAVAAYTKLWRVYDVYLGSAHLTAIDLHKRYGKVVRVGPNHVSISDPDFISVFYGIKETYTKSDFYPLQRIVWKKKVGRSDHTAPSSMLTRTACGKLVLNPRSRIP